MTNAWKHGCKAVLPFLSKMEEIMRITSDCSDFMTEAEECGCSISWDSNNEITISSDRLTFDMKFRISESDKLTIDKFLKNLDLYLDRIDENPDPNLLADYKEAEREAIWQDYFDEAENLVWDISQMRTREEEY
jgi:hypothetical protein